MKDYMSERENKMLIDIKLENILSGKQQVSKEQYL
jgi:hypothetical protein